MNNLCSHVKTKGNKIYKSNMFSWPATYNSFASRGVSVREEEVIYKPIFVHSFSEHMAIGADKVIDLPGKTIPNFLHVFYGLRIKQ